MANSVSGAGTGSRDWVITSLNLCLCAPRAQRGVQTSAVARNALGSGRVHGWVAGQWSGKRRARHTPVQLDRGETCIVTNLFLVHVAQRIRCPSCTCTVQLIWVFAWLISGAWRIYEFGVQRVWLLMESKHDFYLHDKQNPVEEQHGSPRTRTRQWSHGGEQQQMWECWFSRSETMQHPPCRAIDEAGFHHCVCSNIMREDCDAYNILSVQWRSARSLVCRGSRGGFSVNETSHIFAEDQNMVVV